MKLRQLWIAGGLSLLTAQLPAAFAQDNNFFGAKRFPTLASSGGVKALTADLNGDSHEDVVIIENVAGGFSVHFGDGTGNYEFAGSQANLPFSQDGELIDINGDNQLDIVIRESFNNNLFSLFIGNGDGTFTFDSESAFGLSNMDDFTVVDVSGDGQPELIVTTFTNSGQGRLNILPGLNPSAGSGFWGSATIIALNNAAENELSVGDVNADGAPEIIVTVRVPDNQLNVFINNGAGGFSASAQSPIQAGGAAPDSAIVADLNNDGNPDIAYPVRSPGGLGQIGLLQGDGNGAFLNPVLITLGQSSLIDLVAADFNNDGVPDLAGANFTNDSVLFLQGTGGLEYLPHVYSGSGANTFALALADANEDGNEDVVAVNIGSTDFTVHIGTGDESFFTSPQFTRVPRAITDVVAGDLTGDNQTDVLTANASAGSITLLSNFDNGRFTQREDIAAGLSAPTSVTINDVNNDNINDVVVTNRTTDSVAVMLGEGDGTLSPAVSFDVCDSPFRLAVDDLNGDGNLDIVTACFNSASVAVLLGDGTGSFGDATEFNGVAEPQALVLIDADDNGTLDLFIADSAPGTSAVRLMLGAGNGTFGLPNVVATGNTIAGVAAGHFNEDDNLDLVMASLSDGLFALPGLGFGSFDSPQAISGPNSPLAVDFFDVNADGFDDVIAIEASTGQRSRATTVTMSNGDGSFQVNQLFAVANGVDAPFAEPGILRTLTVADVNEDGRDDVLVGIAAAEFPGAVSVNLNQFTPIGQTDTDGDGVTDINDNCTLVINPAQRDTNGDGFGNFCDPDLNNDGIVNFIDFGLLRDVFLSTDQDADFDGNGVVNFLDVSLAADFFLLPPGPSAGN